MERHIEQSDHTNSQAPRVHFCKQLVWPPPTSMIVTSPTEPIVASPSPPQVSPVAKAMPKSILKQKRFVASDSIAERLQAHHNCQSPKQASAEPEMSIAEQVAACQRQKVQTNPVLDYNFSKILKYKQLLHHPMFKEAWN